MNLDVDYNYALAQVGINLVVLVSEIESFSFLVLMSLKVSHGESKQQGARRPLTCILDSLINFKRF